MLLPSMQDQRKMYRCVIYKSRPEICREFPSTSGETLSYPSCSYSFDNKGIREGKCSRCGECCLKLYKDVLNLGRKFNGEPCPYLVGIARPANMISSINRINLGGDCLMG